MHASRHLRPDGKFVFLHTVLFTAPASINWVVHLLCHIVPYMHCVLLHNRYDGCTGCTVVSVIIINNISCVITGWLLYYSTVHSTVLYTIPRCTQKRGLGRIMLSVIRAWEHPQFRALVPMQWHVKTYQWSCYAGSWVVLYCTVHDRAFTTDWEQAYLKGYFRRV